MPRPRRTGKAPLWAVGLLCAVLGLQAAPVQGSDALRAHLQRAAQASVAATSAHEPEQGRILIPELVRALYAQRDYEPLWSDARAVALIALIEQAPTHGLSGRDYLLPELRARVEPSRLPPAARADVDLLFTEEFLRYTHHLWFGKVDPRSLDARWNYASMRSLPERLAQLEELLESPDLTRRVEREMGYGFLYENLRDWLQRYREFTAAGGWDPVPPGPALRPGDRSSRVMAVRGRLGAEGFPTDETARDYFDDALAARVREFQVRHGLLVDGVVGRATLAAMNVPVQARIDQIRVNLERLRWVARDWEPRFIGINIAGFRAYYVDGDSVRWSTRAVVGRAYRQTPVFRATLTHLVLNPDWTLPPTILRNDTLPAIAADPAYLQQQNMDVIDAAGRIIDPGAIDWSRYPREGFPHQIRQRPGPANALGRIKFMFPNEHFVFLHDTPATQLFEASERSFSSGCIRIEYPLELAARLLQDLPGWDQSALEREIATGRTQTIRLATKVPVLVAYFTAIAFRDAPGFTLLNDIYGRDPAVLAALDADRE
jgi:L,D-transpeptidase YcbB